MRGEIDPQPEMFSYVDLESRIPPSHPIRKIRRIVDAALMELEPAFAEMYSDRGGHRFRRNSCCGPYCCRFCSRYALSGC